MELVSRSVQYLIVVLVWTASASAQPNIIHIMADDLGYADVGYTGGTMYETPIIDSMANNAAVFSRYYASPACSPSRAMLLTGRYAFRYGFEEVLYSWDTLSLPVTEDQFLLPRWMKRQGYETAHFGKWHVGHSQAEQLPSGKGYDYTSAVITSGGATMYTYEINGAPNLVTNGELDSLSDSGRFLDDIITDRAVVYIGEQAQCANTPFYMNVHLYSPHFSNDLGTTEQAPDSIYSLAPGGYTALEKRYWSLVKNFDLNVQKVWDAVIAAGIEDNTVIIVTSDNGGDVTYAADNTPYSGEKRQSLEGGMRVPFLMYWKDSIQAQTIDSVTHLVDMLPTFVEGIAGGDLSEIRDSIDGVNIMPLVEGGTIDARIVLGWLIKGRTYAAIKSQYKLCNNCSSYISFASLSDSEALYDVVSDETESADILSGNTAIADEIRAFVTALTPAAFVHGSRITSAPGGWWDVPGWGIYRTFYNENYIWKR